jgi:hypothetical protein
MCELSGGWIRIIHSPLESPRMVLRTACNDSSGHPALLECVDPSGCSWAGHQCEFCHDPEASGRLNLGVPFGDVIFIAPELVVHYMTRHRYLPPEDFITAVMRSALPGTGEYQAAVARSCNVSNRRQTMHVGLAIRYGPGSNDTRGREN